MTSADLLAPLPGDGHVLFTTRVAGNMSSVGGDGAERGAGNRERLCVGLGLQTIARGYQVHGNEVEIVMRPPPRELPPERLRRVDGQATALRGVGVMVLAADCVPVALGALGAVAVVHAGWRGLAAGVLERGIEVLHELAGPDAPLEAVIGPGAGGCCYEVGPEVLRAFGMRARGHARIDLRALARERLVAAGVAHVAELGGCTICDPRFFSHRREGERAGRIVGVAWRS